MGLGSYSNIVHLIDFGLSKNFEESKYCENLPVIGYLCYLLGTARFMSVNDHFGIGFDI